MFHHFDSCFVHKRGKHEGFQDKTRVSEPFRANGRLIFCTGAVVWNFLHRRGGFGKSCETIAPVVENASSRKSSKNDEFLTILPEKVGQSRAESPLFLMRGPVLLPNAFRSSSGAVSGLSGRPSGRLPGPPPDASRAPSGRLPDPLGRRPDAPSLG